MGVPYRAAYTGREVIINQPRINIIIPACGECSEQMQQSKAVFVCLLLGVVGWCACDTLKISAFNIRIFGKLKLQNEDVVATLVRVSRIMNAQ